MTLCTLFTLNSIPYLRPYYNHPRKEPHRHDWPCSTTEYATKPL